MIPLQFFYVDISVVFYLVREARNEGSRGGRGGGRGAGSGYVRGGRGGRGFNRDSSNDENSFSGSGGFAGQGAALEGETGKPVERYGSGGPRGSFRGGRRGGFSNGDAGEEGRPRRAFDRRSGTGRGFIFSPTSESDFFNSRWLPLLM